MELLFQNGFHSAVIFFWTSWMSWNLRPFKANLRGPKHWEPNVANEGGFPVSQTIDFWALNCLTALCKLEHCHDEGINCWAKFKPCSTPMFMQTRHYFYTVNVVDGLAMWYDIVVNNTHDIEEGDKHYLDLYCRHANLFGLEVAGSFTACFAIWFPDHIVDTTLYLHW